MDHATLEQVRRLAAESSRLPPQEREAFLRTHCGSEAILAEVRAMAERRTADVAPSVTTGHADTDSTESLIGRRVGPYLITDSLGQGGMGAVFLGTDVRLHRKVALKSLRSSLPDGIRERARILREARAAAQVNHPNVATVHDVLDDGTRAFIVMEYVQGESLAVLLRRTRLPLDRVLTIGRQLAGALSAAHARGVVHRDLKPANIQVTAEGSVKVLDFGVAAATAAFTTVSAGDGADDARGEFAGTPGYMAPEQLMRQHVDERSDVFGMGLVLFEMATGERAYPSNDALELIASAGQPVRRADVVSPAVPRGVADLIAKALAPEPGERFQTAAALDAALATLQRQLATQRDRRRVMRLVAIGVGVAIVAGVPAWKLATRPPASSGFRPRGWALIADFDNRSGEPALAQTIQGSLAIALQQSAYVNVFSRNQLFEALGRMKQRDVRQVTEDLALEACRREGLDVLVAGTVTQSGAAVQIVVRGIEAARGRLMFVESVEFEEREQLFGKIDELARRVRSQLGESLAGIERSSEPLAKVTTSSLDALRLYSDAVDAVARGAVGRGAEQLKAALALDPDFAMAHVALSGVYSRLGNREAHVEHLSRAYALRDTVTARERRSIEGDYYSVEERYDEAASALSLLATVYPDDTDVYYKLASAREAAGNVSGAIEAVREDLGLRPQSTRAHELLVLLLDRNNAPGEALASYRRATTTLEATPRLRWGAGLAYFGLGQLDEARREFTAMQPDAAYGNIGRLYLARIDLYEGALQRGMERLRADIEGDVASGLTRPEMLRRYLLARACLLASRPGEAHAEAERIRTASSAGVTSRDLEHAAFVLSATGDVAAAARILERMIVIAEQRPSSLARSVVHQIRGEIALAERRLPVALGEFRKAAREYPGFRAHAGLARAHDARGEIELAIQEWLRVVDARGEILRDGFPPDWVLAHLALARLFDRTGERDRAREHATTFLQIWRDADTPTLRAEAERLRR